MATSHTRMAHSAMTVAVPKAGSGVALTRTGLVNSPAPTGSVLRAALAILAVAAPASDVNQ